MKAEEIKYEDVKLLLNIIEKKLLVYMDEEGADKIEIDGITTVDGNGYVTVVVTEMHQK